MLPEGDDLILENRGLVGPVVRRLRPFVPESVDTEELHAIGTLGLVVAARTYNAARGPFSYWARRKIRDAILDALTEASSRSGVGGHARAFRHELYHVPIDRDHAVEPQSVPAPHPALVAARTELPGCEQRVVELVYDHNHSPREVGRRKMIGLGWRRVQRIHRNALTHLREKLTTSRLRPAA